MFFIISKLFAFLIKPFVWFSIFFIWGVLQFYWKDKSVNLKRFKFLQIGDPLRKLFISLVILYLFGNSVLYNEVNLLWESQVGNIKKRKAEGCKIAVVLGGYSSYDPATDLFRLNDAGDRFLKGFEGLIDSTYEKVILSGGSTAIFYKPFYEAEYAGRYLSELGINSSRIILDKKARNTYENAVYTKAIIDSLNYKGQVALITSAQHMYRSQKCFDKVGVNYIPVVAHFTSSSYRRYNWESILIPHTSTFDAWNALIHEWIGIIAYKLTGKI